MLLKKKTQLDSAKRAITSLKYSTASSLSLHEGCISSRSSCVRVFHKEKDVSFWFSCVESTNDLDPVYR